MATEVVGIPTAPERRGPTLTQRASLNAIASLLDYAAKLAVGFVVTPIVVAALGRSLFGTWEMLNRLVTYMSAADGRPTEAIRLMVANRQAVDDATTQRRYVGAALAVWLLFLPVITAAGGLVIWLAPGVTKAAPDLHGTVRVATALLLASFFMTLVAGVPESVLRGMNLGYRRMGLQASLNLVGGLLMIAAGRAGLGLLGPGGRRQSGVDRQRRHAGAGRPDRARGSHPRRSGAARAPDPHLAARHRDRGHDPRLESVLPFPVGRTAALRRPLGGPPDRRDCRSDRLHSHRRVHHRRSAATATTRTHRRGCHGDHDRPRRPTDAGARDRRSVSRAARGSGGAVGRLSDARPVVLPAALPTLP